MSAPKVVVVGAGPAGLAAAGELLAQGFATTVLERRQDIGGIARTEQHRGYRFDIGGHRFLTRSPRIQRLWEDALGPDLLTVSRLSRIYYGGRFFAYPLNAFDALVKMGATDTLRILASYARARVRPIVPEHTFERWVTNRFGSRLFELFFKTYTEKVWGLPCHEISADWAAQRIRGLSLSAALLEALGFNGREFVTLTRQFHYPRLGPGMMWERLAATFEQGGGCLRRGIDVVGLRRQGRRVHSVVAASARGVEELPADFVVSSMNLPALVQQLDPPEAVRDAARALRHRALVVVCLIVRRANLFADNWIYVHDPQTRVGRIQNFGNWSRDLVPDPGTTSLGLEYFCSEGDDLWSRTDAQMIELAREDMAAIGLAGPTEVEEATVVREAHAYPVYDERYRDRVECLRGFLASIDNVQTIGRNGLHRYNNMDHSMMTGLLAAENLAGASHDVWSVNTEPDYLESGRAGDAA